MNITGRPVTPKRAKARRDPDHMARIARLPCVVCQTFGEPQTSPTQVHHVICGRYGTRRAPDTETIPLCWEHHLGPKGIHTNKRLWVERYGPDYSYL